MRHTRDTDARTTVSTTGTTPGTTPETDPGRTPGTAPRPAARRFLRRPSRAALVAAPLALVATAATVAVGVTTSEPAPETPVAAEAAAPAAVAERPAPVSRGGARQAAAVRPRALQQAFDRNARLVATQQAIEAADTKKWTTAPLNLWTLPGKGAKKVGVLPEGRRVLVTGRRAGDRLEIVVKGRARWVSTGYLSAVDPAVIAAREARRAARAERAAERQAEREAEEAAEAAAAGDGECTNGTSVSPGVSQNIVAVHRAVCSAFPEITSYGDFRGDGEHAQGIALDIMVSGDRGWQVAEFLRSNYSELGISYLIYSQQIWSVERGGEGWRGMEDRGSTTANHYDHVHVTTY